MKTREKKHEEESLSYTVEVRDKEGRVIRRISAPSRSYVQQWNQLIGAVAREGVVTIKDWTGTNRNVDGGGSGILECLYNGKGIQVGKGTTAVAIDDYALETPCEQGTGTDEFDHQSVTFTAPSVAGSTCSFTASRVMVNNSGATITGIKEIGCYVKGGVPAWIYHDFLAFRDILPSAVYVPNGGAITVTYTIKVTV